MKTPRFLHSFQPRFPRRITPYRTVRGALESLDNGGRFWNLLARAQDERIDASELARATGTLRAGLAAFVAFELSLAELDERERAEVRSHLSPRLKRRFAPFVLPHHTSGRELPAAIPGTGWIVAGEAHLVGHVTLHVRSMIMVGKVLVPVVHKLPYAELELALGGRHKLRVLARPHKNVELSGPVRFAVLTESVRVEGRDAKAPGRHQFLWAWSRRDD